MSGYDVYMDTNVFTNITQDIGGAASYCKLLEVLDEDTMVWNGTSVGKYMNKILAQAYDASHLYTAESAEALPTAFLTLRDSMINVDNVASESLVVNEGNSGGGDV